VEGRGHTGPNARQSKTARLAASEVSSTSPVHLCRGLRSGHLGIRSWHPELDSLRCGAPRSAIGGVDVICGTACLAVLYPSSSHAKSPCRHWTPDDEHDMHRRHRHRSSLADAAPLPRHSRKFS